MQHRTKKKGFTLIELLVALAVTSIVLTAVAALTYAVGSANNASDDTSTKQAQMRYAGLRISELIKYCKLICRVSEQDLAVWLADDNDDGHINALELVYLETGNDKDYIRLLEFSTDSSLLQAYVISPASIQDGSAKTWLKTNCQQSYTLMVPQCSNVDFSVDTQPPQTRFVSISFDLEENSAVHNYKIDAGLRSWAGYLLDGSGNIVSDDD